MTAILLGLLVGASVGLVFALIGIDPPAPASWGGLAGIVGIVVVWKLVTTWTG